MERKNELIHRFYRCNEWKLARAIKIASAGGVCEKCGRVGEEVHHKIHLTPNNVTDPNISINQDNLILLCKDCHNKEHGRFTSGNEFGFDIEGNFIKIKEK